MAGNAMFVLSEEHEMFRQAARDFIFAHAVRAGIQQAARHICNARLPVAVVSGARRERHADVQHRQIVVLHEIDAGPAGGLVRVHLVGELAGQLDRLHLRAEGAAEGPLDKAFDATLEAA